MKRCVIEGVSEVYGVLVGQKVDEWMYERASERNELKEVCRMSVRKWDCVWVCMNKQMSEIVIKWNMNE